MKKLPNYLIALVIVLALLSAHDGPLPVRAAPPLWAFVVVGQSNAVLMCPYLVDDIAAVYGTSPRTICAGVNGSNIASWQPGQPNYYSAVSQVQAAIADGYTVKAVIFNHGENDAEFASTTNYAAQANTFLDAFRAAIGNQYAYVVYTQLGDKPVIPAGFQNFVNWNVIRTAQHEMRANRPTYFMIDKAPYDIYDTQSPPYAHDTPAAQSLIANQIVRAIQFFVPVP